MKRYLNISIYCLPIFLICYISCGKNPAESESTWFSGCVEWTVTGAANQNIRECGIDDQCVWGEDDDGEFHVTAESDLNIVSINWGTNPESITKFPHTENIIFGLVNVTENGMTICI